MKEISNSLRDVSKIYIRNLRLRCILGITDHERKDKQDIIVNITLYTDIQDFKEDSINDVINYRSVCKKVINFIEGSSFYLLETLINKLSSMILKNFLKIIALQICIDKPNALRFCDSVSIEIFKKKESYD